jgi:hypothetical protein
MLKKQLTKVVLIVGLAAASASAQEYIPAPPAGPAGDVVVDEVVPPGTVVEGQIAAGSAAPELLGAVPYEAVPPSLDYNYYYPAPPSAYIPARLYLCPRPVPLHVGYTYITYQAFAPHEFLYAHRRAYVTYHPDGMTLTRVRWK